MIKKLALLAFLMFGLTLSTSVCAQGWNGINPLESTRNDVEKILGKCNEDLPWSCLYKMEKQNVHIIYNNLEPCSAEGILNAPIGTVLSLSIFPQKETLLKNAGFNLRSFVGETDSEVSGVRQYINLNEGITIESKNGFVIGIYYTPPKKTIEKFRCPKSRSSMHELID